MPPNEAEAELGAPTGWALRTSPTITELAAALVAAQAEMPAISKDRENPHFRFKYATLDAIMAAVRAPLAKHGLVLIQGGHHNRYDDGALLDVETLLVHTSGEWLANTTTLPIDKDTAQDVGKAFTYGRRYGVSALLVLATEDDNDAAPAQGAPRQQRGQQRQRAGAQQAPRAAPTMGGLLTALEAYAPGYRWPELLSTACMLTYQANVVKFGDLPDDKRADALERMQQVWATLHNEEGTPAPEDVQAALAQAWDGMAVPVPGSTIAQPGGEEPAPVDSGVEAGADPPDANGDIPWPEAQVNPDDSPEMGQAMANAGAVVGDQLPQAEPEPAAAPQGDTAA